MPYACELPEGCDIVELHRLYMGLTTWVDDALGRVFDMLESAGLADRTLTVFTSDHGENLGSHGYMNKESPKEEAYRIPMVVQGPGVAEGHVSDRVASLVDVAPTLIDAAGGDVPSHLSGRSLSPALVGGGPGVAPHDNHAIFETHGFGVGARSATHMVNLRSA